LARSISPGTAFLRTQFNIAVQSGPYLTPQTAGVISGRFTCFGWTSHGRNICATRPGARKAEGGRPRREGALSDRREDLFTTNADLGNRVLKEAQTFTTRKNGMVAGLRWWMPPTLDALAVSMLSMDEPDHTRLRSIVDEAIRRRAVLDLEPKILAIADELAAELFRHGSPTDLVEHYARKLPLSVICELLGLPRAHGPRFIAWANSLTRLSGLFGFLRMIAGIGPMKRYLEGRLQELARAAATP
jgi:cytochrome P450